MTSSPVRRAAFRSKQLRWRKCCSNRIFIKPASNRIRSTSLWLHATSWVVRAKGHRAFGLDLDPLAVLLAKVWTRTVDARRAKDKAAEVLDRAGRTFMSLPFGEAYPARSDAETRSFIRYWFDSYARRQLAALSDAIRRVHDDATRDVLWCAFSRLIITKSAGASLAMDLAHSRPHREFSRAPVKPFNGFISAVERVVSNCPQPKSGAVGPIAIVKRGDARSLGIDDASIDLVLTSPHT